MATKWWVNDNSDGKWSESNNWASSEGGAGGDGKPESGDDAYFSDTSSSDNCTMDEAAVCDSLVTTSARTSGTDNFTGLIDFNDFDVTVTDFYIDSGTLDFGNGSIAIAGNMDIDGLSGEAAEGTSDITMSGASKTLYARGSQEFYDFIVSGTVQSYDSVEIQNSLVVSGTLTIDGYTEWELLDNSVTTNFTGGTVASGGVNARITVRDGASLSAAGTINCEIWFVLNSANGTMPARTYGADVEVQRTFGAGNKTLEVASGTVTINGNLYMSNGDATGGELLILDAATNDPDFDISGDIDYTGAAGVESILAGDGNWNVAGDIDFTGGTFTPAASEVILDSSGEQAITSNGQSLYDLTSANTHGGAGVTFVDASAITNVLKCITENSTLTYTDGTAHVIEEINLNGQGVGTRITIASTGTSTAPTWEVTTNTSADYLDVSWNNATPGIDIAATNSNDGGNTTAWTFGAGGTTHTMTLGDAVAAADGLGEQTNYHRAMGDATALADAIQHAVTYYRALGETTAVADAVQHAVDYHRALGDTTSLADAIATAVEYHRALNDTTTLQDTLTIALVVMGTDLTFGDAVSAQDAMLFAAQYHVLLGDTTALQDGITFVMPGAHFAETTALRAAIYMTLGHYPYQLLPDLLPEFVDPPSLGGERHERNYSWAAPDDGRTQ